MTRRIHHPPLSVGLLLMLALVCTPHFLKAQHKVPGVVIQHSPTETEIYLGAPSIVIMEDGSYIASHQHFGPGSNSRQSGRTAIYRSTDRGRTWEKLTELRDAHWSKLFVFRGNLYLMGTNRVYGDLVIRKSSDQGETWTEPTDRENGLLRTDHQYHTAPVPLVIHNGRIFRAIEDRYPPEKWGVNFRAMVISAPLDADLLNAASWTISNRLRYNQDWAGSAWLEGNMVVTPDGELVNILRNHYLPEGGRACVTQVSPYGERISFDEENGFIDFPGGCKKFTIRYDAVSGRYYALSNYIPPKFKGHNSERTRNTLALVSSEDLRNWKVNKIILQHPNVEHVGFQYADWQFDGDDLVAVIRTAYPEPDGTHANNCHDANYFIFYRVEDFREGD